MAGQWIIAGHDGLDEIFSQSVGDLSEPEVATLLQRLASRHLTENEIISSSLRKGWKGYAPLLEIERSRGKPFALMTTGTDFHYTARYRNA